MNNAPTIRNMIVFSWAKSREILFPFNFKRWFKILIIVWLAGVAIQGFSANFKAFTKPAGPLFVPQKITTPKFSPRMLPQRVAKMLQASSVGIPPSAGTPSLSTKQVQVPPQRGIKSLSFSPNANPVMKLMTKTEHLKRKTSPVVSALIMAGMIVLGAGFVALALFFLWLSSRFNFVLLDAIVTRKPAIREAFKKHKEAGNSYFRWILAFLGIMLVIFLLVGLIGLGLLGIAKGHVALSVALGIFAGLLLPVILLGMIFFGIVMRDFVLPVMYCEKIPALSAMNKFLEADTFAFGKVFQYLFVIFGFWILAIIIQGIVGILAVVAGVIAGGIVAIPGIVLLKALPLLKLPLIILGSLVAIALVLVAIVVTGMVMLPVAIFFRVFALAYLTRLYPECDLLGFSGNGS
ncbi:MAG: hypothetical protein WC484_01620 [Candidatus Omnitrophota bacterium]